MDKLVGNEKFTLFGNELEMTVSDFWSWAYSDLLNNTSRGVLAEYLVKSSFNFTPSPKNSQVRVDWAPYDVISPSGRRIEVKTAAYLQSWEQEHFSQILFDIAPKRAWHPLTGYAPEAKRNCDLFVFCLYTALSREASILNLDLWEFYVLPTSVLDREIPLQKSISLGSLSRFKPVKASFFDLGNVIETIEL